ncbi:MAG TPA: tetratricopeptide repeat protein [Acidobacteriaceae bacterium]|nr:tetratricopeptide repeat protein [Acidobacteriaceae bacterium]
MDAAKFPVVEASAKPSGSEFGLRGADKADDIDLFVFLFQYSEEAPLTSVKCRDAMLRHTKDENPGLNLSSTVIVQAHGEPLAVATYSNKSAKGTWFHVRGFAADGDLCADIEFSSQHSISTDTPDVKDALESVRFDPAGKQDFEGLFYYATVLLRHGMPKQAAPIYEQSLTLIPGDDTNGKWRRVATDQTVIAYGTSGQVAAARAIASRAIKLDPDYPMNYYNLACADAEQGKADEAQSHLQEAFDRRANVLPGESMPDPTQDDSIQKLKGDPKFWSFVQSLQRNR